MKDIDDLLAFGQMAFDLGQYERAREYYEQALALDATDEKALNGLAQIEYALSRRKLPISKQVRTEPAPSSVKRAIDKLRPSVSAIRRIIVENRRFFLIVIVFALLLFTSVWGIELYREEIYRRKVSALGLEWLDAYDLALVTPRIVLGEHVAELQRVRRELAALKPPRRFNEAHEWMLKGLDATLVGFYDFMRGDEFAAKSDFGVAEFYLKEATKELQKSTWPFLQ